MILVFVVGFLLLVGIPLHQKMYPLSYRPTSGTCVRQIQISLAMYAETNNGVFPYHPDGYADAFLLLYPSYTSSCKALTGPYYNTSVLKATYESGGDVPEDVCGYVYIQGLSKSDNQNIIILFEKVASHGGWHFSRGTPLGRRAMTLGGERKYLLNKDWDKIVSEQIKLLKEAGFDSKKAERYYLQEPRAIKQGWQTIWDN